MTAHPVSVLVAAAGVGSRLGLGPKAFLELAGRSLLARVTDTALALTDDVHAAIPQGFLDLARAQVDGRVVLLEGGASRQETFTRLLPFARGEIVLLLDIARPLLSVALCRRVIDAAARTGAAGAFVPALVPCARVDTDGRVIEAVAASDYRLPQMPQAFRREVLVSVLERAAQQGLQRQTIWQLTVELGVPLQAVPGEPDNIKITEPNDWRLAQQIVAGHNQDTP
ncbi:MAG: 2-C-methyl-D-erythritol 4-phosphate cytidylyltransferase [Ahniella sp.]|nr:2-C-methyl-D-erythritol 4-phosphate cytidylyltransferase [Ahniella sp.]